MKRRLFQLSSFLICLQLFFFQVNSDAVPNQEVELKSFCLKNGFECQMLARSKTIILKKGYFEIHFLNDSTVALVKDNRTPHTSQTWMLDDSVKLNQGKIILPPSLVKKLSNLSENRSTISNHEQSFSNVTDNQGVPSYDHQPINYPVKKKNINFIILDAGHGGKDPGNVNNGIKEKDVVLPVTLKVYRLLRKKYPNIRIILTRNSDYFVTLENRALKGVELSRLNHNGIFVSIHANATLNPNARGIETFYFSSNAKYKSKLRKDSFSELTEPMTENPHAHKVISKMYDIQISKESKYLAELVNNSLYKQLQNHTINRGIKGPVPYYVITHNNLPSILVEVGFLSNKKEAKLLIQSSYQNKISYGIVNGIVTYVTKFNETGGFIHK